MLCGQARGEDGNGGDYIVFGMVLFLWEHVPAWSVVLFFRAQRLNQNLVRYHNIPHAQSHFFLKAWNIYPEFLLLVSLRLKLPDSRLRSYPVSNAASTGTGWHGEQPQLQLQSFLFRQSKTV